MDTTNMTTSRIQAQDVNAGDAYRGKMVTAKYRSGDTIDLHLENGQIIFKQATDRITVKRF